ncbi:MAG: DNRLRE domain-containing protein, partial [Candidatus Heimdallarchaeota archaeon]|nr:DNRLRE domain-containing protein [Candidatus Heimdallarchaeota archaeon]
MKKRKEIILVLGFCFLFAFIFFILSFTQTSQKLIGYTIYDSQPDATEGIDTYIREDFPNNNFATATTLSIGKTAANKEFRAILQFNTSSIPSTNTIVSATAQVYLETASGNSDIPIKAYRLTSEWIETEASWNDKTSSSPWSSAGGDYNPT